MSLGSRPSISWRCSMNTHSPFFSSAMEGDEGNDVFVHQSDIYSPGFRVRVAGALELAGSATAHGPDFYFFLVCRQSLAEGERVEFRLTTDDKTGKTKAVDVTGPDGAYVQGAPRPNFDDDYY